MSTLTKTQRNKIAIASDVIAQIKLRKFKPTTGVYVSGEILNNIQSGDDLQEKVQKMKKGASCEVCALGSAFLSCVNLKNNYTITDTEADYNSIDEGRMREKLEEFFDDGELGVIEACFEVQSYFLGDAGLFNEQEEFTESEGFTTALEELSEEQRLVFVMQSIINLDGKITLEGVKQQLLIAIAIDPAFASLRTSLQF